MHLSGIFRDFFRGFVEYGHIRSKVLTIAVCLLISCLFWIFNSLNHDYTTNISFPVKFLYDKKKCFLRQQSDNKVELAISGYGWTLLSLHFGYNKKPIELDAVCKNKTTTVSSSDILHALHKNYEKLRVTQIVSENITYQCEQIIEKEVRLKLDMSSVLLQKGKKIEGTPSISPSTVSIRGPKSEVSAVPKVVYVSLIEAVTGPKYETTLPFKYKPSPNIASDVEKVTVQIRIR